MRRALTHRLTRAARASEARFRMGFERTPTASALVGGDGRFLEANAAMAAMLGLPPAELRGFAIADVAAPAHRERIGHALRRAGSGEDAVPFEATLRSFGRGELLGSLSFAAIGSGAACFYLQIDDVTEQRRAEDQRAAIARDNALILDCAGDGILRTDTAGRIVYANPAAAQLLGWTVDELVGADGHSLMHHSRVDGTPYPPAACPIRAAADHGQVGRVTDEVFWRKDGSSFAVDYTSAPIRDDGRVTGAVCVFADITDRVAGELEARQQDRWRARIDEARRTGRFLVYSQPILDLAAGEIGHEELLVRMRGAGDEVIPPARFLPEAERHGLMPDIDQWMISQAVRMAARGRRVAVNISAQSLGRPELVGEIAAALETHGADASCLTFEITETAAVHQMDDAHDFAVALNALGCGIALDDFGTGFGSFSYLKSFPAQYLKIDIEFVRDLIHSESDQRIVQTIVRMARDFGQQTIAEGVEDAATLELLRGYGVDFAQGYFIGRPLPAERGIV
jgi:PAS domain S-box-containing protein